MGLCSQVVEGHGLAGLQQLGSNDTELFDLELAARRTRMINHYCIFWKQPKLSPLVMGALKRGDGIAQLHWHLRDNASCDGIA